MKENLIKRTNLYKNVKMNIKKSAMFSSIGYLSTISCFLGTIILESSLINESINNPKLIPVTTLLGIGGMLVGSITTKEAKRETLEALKYARKLVVLENDMINNKDNDYNTLVLKYKNIEKPKLYKTYEGEI